MKKKTLINVMNWINWMNRSGSSLILSEFAKSQDVYIVISTESSRQLFADDGHKCITLDQLAGIRSIGMPIKPIIFDPDTLHRIFEACADKEEELQAELNKATELLNTIRFSVKKYFVHERDEIKLNAADDRLYPRTKEESFPSKIDLKLFEEIPNGEIFRTGFVQDSPRGVNMTNSGNELRYVAKKGEGNDWAIYVHWPVYDVELVATKGDKISGKENIMRCVPCTEEVFKLYRK